MLGRLLATKESAEASSGESKVSPLVNGKLSLVLQSSKQWPGDEGSEFNHYRTRKKLKVSQHPPNLNEINFTPLLIRSSYSRHSSLAAPDRSSILLPEMRCSRLFTPFRPDSEASREVECPSIESLPEGDICSRATTAHQPAYRPTSMLTNTAVVSKGPSYCLKRPAYPPTTKLSPRNTRQLVSFPTASMKGYKSLLLLHGTFFSPCYGAREAFGSPNYTVQDLHRKSSLVCINSGCNLIKNYVLCSTNYSDQVKISKKTPKLATTSMKVALMENKGLGYSL